MVATNSAETPASGRCAPTKHTLPESARPGTVTKCRTCRASVRVPREHPSLMPVADHEAELERRTSKVAAWRARELEKRQALEAEVERLTDENARLEEELKSSGKRCEHCGGEKHCPRCWQGGNLDF